MWFANGAANLICANLVLKLNGNSKKIWFDFEIWFRSKSDPVWPDLANFCLVLGNILRVYLLFEIILDRLGQILHDIGQVFIEVNGQMLKNKLAVWSHWFLLTFEMFRNKDRLSREREREREREEDTIFKWKKIFKNKRNRERLESTSKDVIWISKRNNKTQQKATKPFSNKRRWIWWLEKIF